MNVFTNNTFDMSPISRNMLKAHFMCRPGNPILCMSASISKHILRGLISDNESFSGRGSCVKTDRMCCASLWFCGDINLDTTILDDVFIDFSCSHPKEVILGWDETSVPREVLLLKYLPSMINALS